MIDPAVLAEMTLRVAKLRATIERRRRAGEALAWLSEHALTPPGKGLRSPADAVLPTLIRPIASATPNADVATVYLSTAFVEHHRAIIRRAIDLAAADFARQEGDPS